MQVIEHNLLVSVDFTNLTVAALLHLSETEKERGREEFGKEGERENERVKKKKQETPYVCQLRRALHRNREFPSGPGEQANTQGPHSNW